jgi:hypothetical protein
MQAVRSLALLLVVAGCSRQRQAPAPLPAPVRAPAALSAASASLSAASAWLSGPEVRDRLAALTVVTVTRGPVKPAPIAAAAPPKLSLTREVRSEAAPEIVSQPAASPEWLPQTFRGSPIWYSVPKGDGGRVAFFADHAIVFFSASHEPTSALDFTGFRGDFVRSVDLCCDHVTVDAGTRFRQIERVGEVIVGRAADLERDDMYFLVAVGARDGTFYWKTPRLTALEDFAVVGSHLLVSHREQGHWAIEVRALDSGRVVDRLVTQAGPYALAIEGGEVKGTLKPLPDAHGSYPRLNRGELRVRIELRVQKGPSGTSEGGKRPANGR